jgi:acyl-CoA synthetase (AMP-forming)/AMP-acid ligase II
MLREGGTMITNFSRVMATMAMRYRHNIAVVNMERGRRYTYPEYHRLTNRIANMSRDALHLRHGDIAMLLLDNDSLSLVHFPAIFKQEATFLLGNLRDGKAEHVRQIEQMRPRVVFIETRMLADYQDLLRQHGCTVVAMERDGTLPADVHCFWELVEAASDADNDVALDVHRHIALLRLTSGTTGQGKVAQYAMDHLFALRDSAYVQPDFAFNEATRYLALTPLSHAAIIPFIQTLFTGGTTYTLNAPDLAQWCETVQRERITHGLLVPTLLYRLLDMNSTGMYDLSSLTTLTYGAAPIAPAAVERLVAEFGQIFIQGYAASEVLNWVSNLNKADHRTDTEAARRRLASAGRVSPGVEILIIGDDGEPQPTGGTGEICLRTRGTINGYWHNQEATNAEFSDSFWKSGDLGYVDEDGYLFIIDRKKDMIISGGFNVYAVEIEAALSEHPAVLMSAVVGVPHPEWGEAVHAEVVLRERVAVSTETLIEHVKTRLGSYKAPKTVKFVADLPMSSVGKVLRRQVRQPYWSGQARAVH